MLSGGDYITPPSWMPPWTVSGGDGEPLQQAGEGTGNGAAASGGNVSPASGGAPGDASGGSPGAAGTGVSAGDALSDILSMLPVMENGSGEAAPYAGTETVSGNGTVFPDVVAAMQEGFLGVCMLLGLISGILFVKSFFVWKVRD